MDIEIVNTKSIPYINDKRIDSMYKDLTKAFEWVNNSEGEKKIKQCIDNIATNVFQNGQRETRTEMNITIDILRFRVKELEAKYEPKEKDQDRGYGSRAYNGD